jgi:hypothetical protein
MLKRIFPINTALFSTFIKKYQTMTRFVEKKILSVEQSEGVGARVRRSIGTSQVCKLTLNFLVFQKSIFILGTEFRSIFNA